MIKRVILLVLLSFITINFGVSKFLYNKKKYTTEYKDTSFLTKELNDSILYLALVYYEIKEPKIVLAQAKLESGNFTSKLYKQNKNFLGLYNSKEKKYFKFEHWSECILAYKNKIEYKHQHGEDYYCFLDRIGYASDPNYINKVKEIETKL